MTVTAVPARRIPRSQPWCSPTTSPGSAAAARRGRAGFGTFCGVFQFGSLGHEDFAESLRLFAGKVLPSLRGLP